MNDLDRIISLAKIVRCAFEKNDPGNPTLSCRCYRASVELFCLAKDENINIKLAGNTCHVFCTYNDVVIDVTATQFGHPDKISIGKINEWEIKNPYNANYWEVKWSGSTIEEAKKNGHWSLDCDHKYDRKMVLEYMMGTVLKHVEETEITL